LIRICPSGEVAVAADWTSRPTQMPTVLMATHDANASGNRRSRIENLYFPGPDRSSQHSAGKRRKWYVGFIGSMDSLCKRVRDPGMIAPSAPTLFRAPFERPS
jgi:hypothetical protein